MFDVIVVAIIVVYVFLVMKRKNKELKNMSENTSSAFGLRAKKVEYIHYVHAMISPACCRRLNPDFGFPSESDLMTTAAFSPGVTNVMRLTLAVVLRLMVLHSPGNDNVYKARIV